MWSRVKLYVGKFSDNRGPLNSSQGLWKLRRGYLDIFRHEHAKMDNDLVCRTRGADPVDGLSQSKTLIPVQNDN